MPTFNKRSVSVKRFCTGHFCVEFFFEESTIGAFNLKKIEYVFSMLEAYYSGTCDSFKLLNEYANTHAML